MTTWPMMFIGYSNAAMSVLMTAAIYKEMFHIS